jgi:LysR family transcriptional regulator, transcriptional activator of the cysJI operon
MLDVYALRVFLEAARAKSFTRAAEMLSITQPAVSHQIKSLEDYLQIELFERTGRSVKLTKAGQTLVPLARQVVEMVASVEEHMHTVEGEVTGDLVIGCSEPSAHYLLPYLLSRFKRIYPNVNMTVPVVSQETLLERLTSGSYDLGIAGTRYLPEHDLHSFPLYEDHLVLVASSTHPWTQRESVRIEDLIEEPFVCRDMHSICRRVVGSELARLGYDISEMRVVMEIDSPEAQIIAVEHGLGLAFMPLMAVMQRLPMGRLAIVKVEGLSLASPVFLLASGERKQSLVHEKFIKFINVPATQSLIEMVAQGRTT